MGIEAKWGMVAKPCDSCNTAAALLFCRSHNAFMCLCCDESVHSGISMHERVWMCEVCEMAPASVTCKADAAALCVTCDQDIHSVNPLARRHERIAVVPFYSTPNHSKITPQVVPEHVQGMSEESSWVQSNPKLTAENPDTKLIEFLLSDTEQLLDFDILDGVVPVQTGKPPLPILNNSQENVLEIDFKRSNQNSFTSSYTAQSFSQSVSSSSLDVGVVPDGSSDMSYPFALQMNTIKKKCTEREAKVMRYREKRKNRKFQKTIRYASRKAYAETRPRIKGRFAKRNEVEEDNCLTAFMTDHGYSVVPSFCFQ